MAEPQGLLPGSRQRSVLVVMTDDQGAWSVPWLMPELRMPALAELRETSVTFKEAYCSSPVCSPSRASMLTGRLPSAHGVHDWLVGEEDDASWPDRYLDGQPTTPEIMQRAGLVCGMVGKWHVGDSREPAPGFDFWYAHRTGGGPYVDAPVWRDGEPVREPRYLTEAITDEALGFLSGLSGDDAFYLQVNYTAPHTPWRDSHPQRYTDIYEHCDFPSVPRVARHPSMRSDISEFELSFDDPEGSLVGYCAALTGVDDGLAKLMDWLKSSGRWEDTLIVFTSDNGFACGQHGVWGKGNATYPLNFWDASVRVPLLVRFPGVEPREEDAVTSTGLLHQSLCRWLGMAPQQDRWGLPGVIPLLDADLEGRPEYVEVHAEYGDGRMITNGRWKFIWRPDGNTEFYDRLNDPSENTNLADEPQHFEQQKVLREELARHFRRYSRPGAEGVGRGIVGNGQRHPLTRGAGDESFIR